MVWKIMQCPGKRPLRVVVHAEKRVLAEIASRYRLNPHQKSKSKKNCHPTKSIINVRIRRGCTTSLRDLSYIRGLTSEHPGGRLAARQSQFYAVPIYLHTKRHTGILSQVHTLVANSKLLETLKKRRENFTYFGKAIDTQ
jgi:hypothetical protein